MRRFLLLAISELTGGLWLSHFSDKIHPPVTQTEIKDVINIGEGWSGKLAFLFTEI